MPDYRDAVTTCPVTLPRAALARMLRLVRTLYRLGRWPAYRARVLPLLPEVARFDPGHDAVMMGYDFHLGPEGPRLIEVNTNAGGALLAYLAHFPSTTLARERFPARLRGEFLHAFAEEMELFSGGRQNRPRRIAIVDEQPESQYLFREMAVFVELFEEWGVPAVITDPAGLEAGKEGVFFRGERIDLIYNRHCDFYLASDEMAGIRQAYRNQKVCLTPNPFVYGLLADKRRMALWSDPAALEGLDLSPATTRLLQELVPETRLLADLDREALWGKRREWIFKPVTRFGSRGVLTGAKISRSRFDDLPSGETLAQRFVPPSLSEPCGEEPPMKTDFRLYVYRQHVLGLAARIYQGQVTNLRTPGGGFAPVRVI